MAKEELLRELYDIIDEISVFALKPFEKFYAENSNKSEAEIGQILRTAKQALKLKRVVDKDK